MPLKTSVPLRSASAGAAVLLLAALATTESAGDPEALGAGSAEGGHAAPGLLESLEGTTGPEARAWFEHELARHGAGEAQAEPAAAVRVSEQLLSAGFDDHPVVESHLAVNPNDPRHLLATAMAPTLELPPEGEGLTDASYCPTWTSRDGGATWSRHDHPVTGCADPWVAITHEGVALFATLGNEGAFVFRSPDGGTDWDPYPYPVGDYHDHPVLAVDTVGPRAGSVYWASGAPTRNPEGQRRFAVYVARSIDQGVSFPYTNHVVVSNLNYEAQTPVVLSDSTLLVPLSDHGTADGRRIEFGARRAWAVRSRDGGRTFTEPLFISDQCDGRGGWPQMAVPPDDSIYFTCVSVEYASVLVLRSTSAGESWEEVGRLGADVDNSHVRVASIAATGEAVGVTWYDRRDDPERACQRLYFAASIGGGEFGPPTAVSTELSCPDSEGNGWTSWRFPGGGDYAGLVATGPRSFYTIWSDARSGGYRLYGSPITIEP